MLSRRVLCLWLVDWPLQRLLLEQPHLRQRKVLLYELTPRRTLQLAAFTPSLGCPPPRGSAPRLLPGLPLAEALARLDPPAPSDSSSPIPNSPHLQPLDPWGDRQALERLAEGCRQFSPLVGIQPADRPDCLLLDVSGLEHLFGGETALIRQVAQSFSQRGLSVRAAVADTLGAAWAVAQGATGQPTGTVVDGQASGQFWIVPPGETSAALAPLPLDCLRLPRETSALLQQLGVRYVGQVGLLPRSSLLSRFGPQLLRRWDQAHGLLPEWIEPQAIPQEFQQEWPFEFPVDRRETIEHVVQQMLPRLLAPLGRRRQGALEISCRLAYLAKEPAAEVPLSLFRPTASPEYLLGLLKLRLEGFRFTGPIHSVRLQILRAAPLEYHQCELFDRDPSASSPQALSLLVDRLTARLGRSAVVWTTLLADAQPEYTSLDVPASEPPSGRSQIPRPLRFTPEERPLFLFSPPQPIEVLLGPHGIPAHVRWAGRSHHLARAWGPERIETGWWRQNQPRRQTFIRRDYYRVETRTGSRFWIFQRRDDRSWFLHGTFD